MAGHESEVDGLEFTTDKKYLIPGGDDGLVKFWDYNTGALIRTRTHGTYLKGGSYVNVAVSADGQYAANAGQGHDMTTKIWRISDGKLIHILHIDGGDDYNTVQFTPDGKFVVSGLIQYGSNGVGWYGRILFWNVSSSVLAKEYIDKQGSPQSGGIRTLSFSRLSGNSYYLSYSVSDKLKTFSIGANGAMAVDTSKEFQTIKSAFTTTAFPNPFNSTTRIEFSLPHKAFVKLTDETHSLSRISGNQAMEFIIILQCPYYV